MNLSSRLQHHSGDYIGDKMTVEQQTYNLPSVKLVQCIIITSNNLVQLKEFVKE